MPRILLPLVEKSLAIALDDDLAALAQKGVIDTPRFLRRFRMLGILALQQTADPDALREWLVKGVFACLDLAALLPSSQRTATVDDGAWDACVADVDSPTFDAIGAMASDDGVAAAVLRLRGGGSVGAVDGSSPWAGALQAIDAHDAEAFATALREALDESITESADPDAALTTDRVSISGIALVKLARRRGIDVPFHHRLVPRDALLPSREPLPPRDAWRTIPSYRSFDA